MPSIFPLEIKETILDFLAEDDEGHSSLKRCSLVCKAFLPICRKHIFGRIVLKNPIQPSPTTHGFERLLRETPEIADYIRKLEYNIELADLTVTNVLMIESLKRISRLKFLTVRYRSYAPHFLKLFWRNNPIRPALLRLLHLPTLTHFKLINIKNFFVSDLIPCVNLKYLDIDIHTTVAAETTFPALTAALPEHSIHLNEFLAGIGTSAAIMELCTARRPDGQPIIDFGSLSKITVDIDNLDKGRASKELFRHCHVLTNVHIRFWDPWNVRPSLADMVRPSMQTLKHIVVNIHVDFDNDDPLFDILFEFEDMCTNNIIETVTITILVRSGAGLCRGDDWGRLDEVLTTPGWFSLKRVSLAIEFPRFNGLEGELRKLPETQFLRLSSSNSVSFDFEVIPTTFRYL